MLIARKPQINSDGPRMWYAGRISTFHLNTNADISNNVVQISGDRETSLDRS